MIRILGLSCFIASPPSSLRLPQSFRWFRRHFRPSDLRFNSGKLRQEPPRADAAARVAAARRAALASMMGVRHDPLSGCPLPRRVRGSSERFSCTYLRSLPRCCSSRLKHPAHKRSRHDRWSRACSGAHCLSKSRGGRLDGQLKDCRHFCQYSPVINRDSYARNYPVHRRNFPRATLRCSVHSPVRATRLLSDDGALLPRRHRWADLARRRSLHPRCPRDELPQVYFQCRNATHTHPRHHPSDRRHEEWLRSHRGPQRQRAVQDGDRQRD